MINVSLFLSKSLLSVVCFIGFSLCNITTSNIQISMKAHSFSNTNIENRKIINVEKLNNVQIIKNDNFEKFLSKMSYLESKHDWRIISYAGYIGKYQFGYLALKGVGLDTITVSKFKENPYIFPPDLQDSAMIRLTLLNYLYLKQCVRSNIVINGIQLHWGNMLAASHLVGAGGFMTYYNSNGTQIVKDGNGVSIEVYLKQFQDIYIDPSKL